MNKTILLSFILIITFGPLKSQDIFNREHTEKFAEFLYSSGDYREATLEYERLLFFDSLNTDAQYKLVRSYRKAGLAGEAQKKYYRFCPKLNCSAMLNLEQAKNLIELKKYSEGLTFLSQLPEKNAPGFEFLTATNLLKLNKWAECENLIIASKNNSAVEMYAPLIKMGKESKNKSPLVAALLSTAIPGLGKVYTGYWKDGLISFILIGVAGFQAYRGFEQKGIQSSYGWIFGLTFTGFYTGNIYGAAKSAYKRNYLLNEKLQNEVDMVYRLYD